MSETTETVVEVVEKTSSTLSSLIPQLFFDLIGRLIPGFVIIWSFYLALYNNTLLDVDTLMKGASDLLPQDNDFFLFCITVVVFYISSILFYGIWSAVTHLIKYMLNINIFVEVIEESFGFSLRHDYIKLNAPIAGSRITKLKAEIHMSGALTAAYLICLIISLASYPYSFLSKTELIIRASFFALGLIGFLFSNLHFTKRLERSVTSYSKLLNYDARQFPE